MKSFVYENYYIVTIYNNIFAGLRGYYGENEDKQQSKNTTNTKFLGKI